MCVYQQNGFSDYAAGPPKDLDMHFNPRKFQVMNISSAPPPPPRMFYQDLEAVEHAKYLGLEIGKFLSWILHIHNVTVKADRTLGYIQVRKIYMN